MGPKELHCNNVLNLKFVEGHPCGDSLTPSPQSSDEVRHTVDIASDMSDFYKEICYFNASESHIEPVVHGSDTCKLRTVI